ncbi:MAG: ORF6N domain-containing protein [Planctomycetaceae bacterium]|nr:ORF6N domain-containing protein [Planctomycetaceae bacterium]
MAATGKLALVESIAAEILELRGQRVILDRDLAALYDVPTGALNRAVKRNAERFPEDFMFQLTPEETAELAKSQKRFSKFKFARLPPLVFTEHGAIMAAGVLNSPRAVEASIFVVRAFVKLRQLLATHKELAHQVAELERRLGDHDEAIRAIVAAIKQLMEPPPAPPKRKIGFAV